MKKDWTYKKLGEVAEIYQPKTLATSELIADGKYLVYGANGVIGRYNEYNHKEKEILVTCRGATCGTINISEPYSWINGNAMVVHIIDDTLSFDFLKYSLNHLDWTNIITGAAQPQITRQNLSPAIIPIPPLSIQRSIVSELDLLHSVIEKKQEQLRALDNLAQSLFYQMFGDPITNPMGWEIKKLGEVADFYNGKAHEQEIDELGKFILINSKFIATNASVYKRTAKQLFPLLKEDIVMVMSDVPHGRALAKCYIIKDNDKYSLNQRICAFRNHKQNTTFLYYVINRNSYFIAFDNGNSQTNLRKDDILDCPIPLPPLSLQQSFAAKVSAIEAQKQAITQSIKDVESLLAQRMDHYFG